MTLPAFRVVGVESGVKSTLMMAVPYLYALSEEVVCVHKVS